MKNKELIYSVSEKFSEQLEIFSDVKWCKTPIKGCMHCLRCTANDILNEGYKPINRYLEYTRLTPSIPFGELEEMIHSSIFHNFLGICIPPYMISNAKKIIRDSSYLNSNYIKLITVSNFPLPINNIDNVIEDIKYLVDKGVEEIDVVIPYGFLKDGDIDALNCSIRSIGVETPCNMILKGIIETSELTKEEIVLMSLLLKKYNFNYIKTSTGFTKSGAKVEDIELIRETVGNFPLIKASGGVSTLKFAKELINAGASRIGTSKALDIDIIKEKNDKYVLQNWERKIN